MPFLFYSLLLHFRPFTLCSCHFVFHFSTNPQESKQHFAAEVHYRKMNFLRNRRVPHCAVRFISFLATIMELLCYVHSQFLTRQITVMKRASTTGSSFSLMLDVEGALFIPQACKFGFPCCHGSSDSSKLR